MFKSFHSAHGNVVTWRTSCNGVGFTLHRHIIGTSGSEWIVDHPSHSYSFSVTRPTYHLILHLSQRIIESWCLFWMRVQDVAFWIDDHTPLSITHRVTRLIERITPSDF